MAVDAGELTRLMNGYTIDRGPPRSITLAGATKIATLGIDITISGEGTASGRQCRCSCRSESARTWSDPTTSAAATVIATVPPRL